MRSRFVRFRLVNEDGLRLVTTRHHKEVAQAQNVGLRRLCRCAVASLRHRMPMTVQPCGGGTGFKRAPLLAQATSCLYRSVAGVLA